MFYNMQLIDITLYVLDSKVEENLFVLVGRSLFTDTLHIFMIYCLVEMKE